MKKSAGILLILILLLSGCSAEKKEAENIPAQTLSINGLGRPNGDLSQIVLSETSELTEEETAQANRAMRAYLPTSGTPLVNNAKSFYYYEQLNSEEQNIYDALMLLVEDPVDENNIIMYSTELDLNSEEFNSALSMAYYAMLYDHPELFWIYNDIKTQIMFGIPNQNSSAGYNDIYFYFAEPYTDFRKDVETFNKATKDFLSDIDLNASEEEIALAIHDKLINTVTYDMDVLNNGISEDLAHTAYGALVENSRGNKNTAVCDGYSLAYEYLLQQAGLEAAVIIGNAGSNESDAGGHAWSIVKIDGKWYEVDSCWDDFGTLEDQLKDYEGQDIYTYYMEALNDEDYRKGVEHYLYRVNTDTISDYKPGNEFNYYSKDGKYSYSLVDAGVHIRASKIADWIPLNALVEKAPIAY